MNQSIQICWRIYNYVVSTTYVVVATACHGYQKRAKFTSYLAPLYSTSTKSKQFKVVPMQSRDGGEHLQLPRIEDTASGKHRSRTSSIMFEVVSNSAKTSVKLRTTCMLESHFLVKNRILW